ncbi:HNH endonuclease signature motif containing protein [Arthrobacter sp. 35W]|uniref:HNH endonuclease signature motif containing protein n=1 Tax=Arthrobacter sp. 35W TaxID=1132441 RepID=UPI000685D76A|nr:HNH endonuclease signature motif containing protein [Arthrobacter sp. 35W]
MDGSPDMTPGNDAGISAAGARPTPADSIAGVRLPIPAAARTASHQTPGRPAGGSAAAGQSEDAIAAVAGARADYDEAAAALAALAGFTAHVAAVQARWIERLHSAARAEASALGLDHWQSELHDISAAAEIATALTIPEQTAHRLLDQSVALVQHRPVALAALDAGELSWRHATSLLEHIEAIEGLPGIDAAAVDAFEVVLVGLACGVTVSKFAEKARRRRERLHPGSIDTRARTAHDQRALLLTPGADGVSFLQLQVTAAQGQAVWNRCTAAARGLQGANEARTLTQLRADVAAALLLGPWADSSALSGAGTGQGARTVGGTDAAGGAGAGHGPDAAGLASTPGTVDGFGEAGPGGTRAVDRSDAVDQGNQGNHSDIVGPELEALGRVPLPAAQILVTVPALALLGLTDEPAELEGYGPISADVARQLAAEAPSFLRLLTDPVTGETLDQAPTRYRVSDAMRVWLRARDRTCTFPGCNVATADTQLDHLLAWERGGTTTADNLASECPKHHLLKHEKDGKNRRGRRRNRPRSGAFGTALPSLRGWTPDMAADAAAPAGRPPAWTSPAGRQFRPAATETFPPQYPRWLIDKILVTNLRLEWEADRLGGPNTT